MQTQQKDYALAVSQNKRLELIKRVANGEFDGLHEHSLEAQRIKHMYGALAMLRQSIAALEKDLNAMEAELEQRQGKLL